MDKSEQAKVWLFEFLDSLRADLRIEGKIVMADKIRDMLKEAMGYKCGDLSIDVLKEYRDAYRIHRNMPNASIVELEMF